jgi:predicted RNA-binding protein with PUA-like domain
MSCVSMRTKRSRISFLLRRGNRLSVMPVSKKEWDFILTLE